MNTCIGTRTVKEALPEIKHMLDVTQSSIRPNVSRVRGLQRALEELSSLPSDNTIWLFDNGMYYSPMD